MTKEPPKLSPHIENMLWLEAFRHHVARQPYSVPDFVRALVARWDYLRPTTQNLIKSELQQEFNRYESGDQRPGMTRNLQDWQQIRELTIGSGAIPIGTRFGLWEITSEPTLSVKGKTIATSKYSCLCHGCGDTYQVRHANLLSGRSTCCNNCRLRQLKEQRLSSPSPSNPVCINCNTVMPICNSWKRERRNLMCKRYRCKECGYSETIYKPLDKRDDHDKEI